jgi:hypothetical protein
METNTIYCSNKRKREKHLNRLEKCHADQWQRGLRQELSSLSRTLGSCVRIPLKAWMFVLSCVYVEVLLQADPPSKEPYRLCMN